ncbi:MAG: DUF3768 domain-containing protein [Rhizobiaceae bacterium]|nr:DUF3768 domain-containing protein [Rhizobiaceae bacterium]
MNKNRTYHEHGDANSTKQSEGSEPNTTLEEDEIANCIDPDHEDWRLREIKRLNDQLRETGEGGTIVVTPGFLDLSYELREQILNAMQREDQFTQDNDPWGEHDMGSVNIEGNTVLWKIDTYDLDMNYLSPEPADPNVTKRVLTIMLASEY